MASRLPFHRAGLSPCRYPWTRAQSSTLSIRPLNLDAVSVFSCQIGRKTFKICESSTSRTKRLPSSGSAYAVSVFCHCCLCLGFFHPELRSSRKPRIASEKVLSFLGQLSKTLVDRAALELDQYLERLSNEDLVRVRVPERELHSESLQFQYPGVFCQLLRVKSMSATHPLLEGQDLEHCL